ncbi:MAG: PAS domain S-box protein [Bacteroidetes bacterium]|nr:PAS domain S-box protein [Bacteroidota bacterium]
MTTNPTTEDLKRQVKALSTELETKILSEERYRIIAEISPDMIFHINLLGKVTYASPATETILGYSPAEAMGSWFSKYYAPHEHMRVRETLRKAIAGESITAVEVDALRKDGKIVPIHISISPIFQKGKVTEIQGIARDISNEKKTQEELREKKDYAELLLQTVPSAVYTVDNNRIIRSWNKRAEEITGYKPEEVIGKHCTFFAKDPCRQNCGLLNTNMKKPISKRECTFITKNGEERNALKNIDYLRDLQGNIIGGIEIFEDVTEILEKDRMLLRIKKAVENSEEGIGLANIEGNMIFINHALVDLLGYALSEYQGIGTPGALIIDENIRKEIDDANDEGKSWTGEVQMKSKDGKIIDIYLHVDVVRDDHGKPIGFLGIHSDITERKEIRRKLEKFMEELQRSNTELEQFAYIASHDLQEPLRKIQAFGDRLLEKYGNTIDERGQDYMLRMQSAAKRMQEMINDLLSFSRVTTRPNPFTETDLNVVMEEVLSDLEARIAKENGKVEISKLPVIKGDKIQLRQLLTNIVGNGLKYHKPDVPPLVTITGERKNGHCIMKIRDNGIGFDESYADKIFQPFQRLHGRNEYEGTGIGLAICKKIVIRHKGEITATSTPGEGSLFTITLPVKPPDPQPISDINQNQQ